jgi:hypothetical protein
MLDTSAVAAFGIPLVQVDVMPSVVLVAEFCLCSPSSCPTSTGEVSASTTSAGDAGDEVPGNIPMAFLSDDTGAMTTGSTFLAISLRLSVIFSAKSRKPIQMLVFLQYEKLRFSSYTDIHFQQVNSTEEFKTGLRKKHLS